MCDAIEKREVWDCCIPAAIREEIHSPQVRKLVTNGSFDSGFNSHDGAYHVAYHRRTRNTNNKTDEQESLWAVFASFFDGVKSSNNVIPPPIFFELHDLPEAPTWSEKDVDHDWLPQSPSLAYDEYSISEES
jgi:hypothetical protein